MEQKFIQGYEINRRKTIFPDNKTRPAYQTPVVVALGELARASGGCTNGGSNVGGVNDCNNGGHPIGTCGTGPSF